MSLGLDQIPLFKSLPSDELNHLETAFPSLEFSANEILFYEGQSDDRFYVLLAGKVEVIKAFGKKEERLLDVCEAGSLLGEMSIFSGDNRHTASVRSITPLRLLQVTRSDFDDLLHRHPQMAYSIVNLLSQRLEQSENLTIRDLKEKNKRLQEAYDELRAAQVQLIEKEKIEKELEIAKQIQKSILPESLPEIPGYEFGAMMIPARAVGGDFYTFFKLPKDRLGIVVGDVSDKGIPAALFMGLCYSLIRAEGVRTESPVQALQNVNAHLLQMNSKNLFVTLVYGILDSESGEFHFARSAHPIPFLMDGNGQIAKVENSSAPPLGIFDKPFIDEQIIHIPPRGILLLYSDGVTEPMDTKGEEFGIGILDRTMSANRHHPAQELCENLWQAVQSHGKDLPQQDDFTTVIVKRSMLS
jgi:phosphoserine phosphatase RsbU/P